MLVINGVDELRALDGAELGVSGWRRVTQQDVDTFAALTGDHQWIHVDTERAKSSPFGGTIAHGYLTLAMASGLGQEIYQITGFGYGLNYGVDKVRFPAPLPVGSRVRMHACVGDVADVPRGGIQVKIVSTLQREGSEKPVCVVEGIKRLYP
jgi:acyl dehydratase